MYKVRLQWSNARSQLGAFSNLNNAKQMAAQNPGFFVFNEDTQVAVFPLPYLVVISKPTTIFNQSNSSAKKVSDITNGTFTIVEVVGQFGKLKSGAGWIKLPNLEIKPTTEAMTQPAVKTPSLGVAPITKKINYLLNMQKAIPTVYDEIVKIKCSHGGSAKNFNEMKLQKKTTCGRSVSFALQEAGVLAPNKIISHTAAVGGNADNILKKKNTLAKVISGLNNLDKTKCDIYYVGAKNIREVPSKYIKNGAVMIQDSNIFCCCGYINKKLTNRSCNNAKGSQVKPDKNNIDRYFNNTVTTGYTFNSPILAVIIPKEEVYQVQ